MKKVEDTGEPPRKYTHAMFVHHKAHMSLTEIEPTTTHTRGECSMTKPPWHILVLCSLSNNIVASWSAWCNLLQFTFAGKYDMICCNILQDKTRQPRRDRTLGDETSTTFPDETWDEESVSFRVVTRDSLKSRLSSRGNTIHNSVVHQQNGY